MTRHSTLTNPNDLHYSKIRTFTGNPSAITPDFADQLLTATDTNKVYRATGASTGDLIELAPTDGNSSPSGESGWIPIRDTGSIQLEGNKKYFAVQTGGPIIAEFPPNPQDGDTIQLFANSSQIYISTPETFFVVALATPESFYSPNTGLYRILDEGFICTFIALDGYQWLALPPCTMTSSGSI